MSIQSIGVFGRNVKAAIALLHISQESLAVKTEIPNLIVEELLKGNEPKDFDSNDIPAILNIIGLKHRVMFINYGEEPEDDLRLAFERAGIELPPEGGDDADEDAGEKLNGSTTSEGTDSVETDSGDSGTESASDPEEDSDEEDVSDSNCEPEGDDLLHTLDPVWESENVVCLGKVKFDISSKDVRAKIMGHIRSLKEERGFTLQGLIDDAKLEKKTNGWFSQVEKGLSRIYRPELESLAKSLQATVGILLTGHGLKPATVHYRGRKSVTKLDFSIERLSLDELQEYFKGRVCKRSVEPAEGVLVGEIFELLGEDSKKIDWSHIWLNKTKEGQKFASEVDALCKKYYGWHPALREIVLARLFED